MIQEFPLDTKIWVFQNNRKFTFEEESKIKGQLSSFFESWNAHGNNLTSFFEIKYNHFIVVGVNEQNNKASGCSIDSLVNKIKEIENNLNLNLLDRSLVGYFTGDNTEEITVSTVSELKKKIKSNQIVEGTQIFNNTVSTKKEFLSNWMEPIEKSWAKIFY